MRVGIVILPDARWSSAGPKWRRAEQYGFDHVWTYDHLGWLDYVDGPWFGAVPTLAAAAVSTTRIKLGMFVASPNFRHPVPFMRELIALDDLADGRFVLGLGAGDDGYDARVLGRPALTARQRADRFAEFVDALDGLLTVDGFDHRGAYFRAEGARNLPGPVQQPRFDFVVAANGPRGMRLATRHGAGWATTGRAADSQDGWWKGVAELADRFDDTLARAGRDRLAIDRYLNLDAAPGSPLSGVAAFTEAAERASELGFTDMVVRWPGADPVQESVLEQVAADILPGLHGAVQMAACAAT
jgi:alkanesulfonate monooxygenase SsuD/methylene tetrahydromethanopterin reductase-like flavin-dependent oxidoreductase (luciferase family)